MLNTVDLGIRLNGGWQVPAKLVPPPVVRPLGVEPVTGPSEPAKVFAETKEVIPGKDLVLQRLFAAKEAPPRPDPMDEAVKKAMTRMVATRQAAERFFMGVMNMVPVNTTPREKRHLLDMLA